MLLKKILLLAAALGTLLPSQTAKAQSLYFNCFMDGEDFVSSTSSGSSICVNENDEYLRLYTYRPYRGGYMPDTLVSLHSHESEEMPFWMMIINYGEAVESKADDRSSFVVFHGDGGFEIVEGESTFVQFGDLAMELLNFADELESSY